MVHVRVIDELAGLQAIRAAWEGLLTRSAVNEPTLAPLWMLAWWRVFGSSDQRALRVALVFDRSRLVGLAPWLSRPCRHRSGLPIRRLELVASGEDEADDIGSDYLGVIAERGAEGEVARALADALAGDALGPWDDLVMPAMGGDGALPVQLSQALRARGLPARVEVTNVSPYIPLPATWDAYLAALSASRRALVRRSIRDVEAWAGGTLSLMRATTRDELSEGTDILMRLHAARWSAEGKPGVFASPRFRAFHGEVMPALLDRGALDLWWIAARGRPIAALYNVVWQDRVYFYQGGRAMDLPRGIRPGTALQAYAIRAAIEAGRREYDFLPGISRYKLELSLAARPLLELRAARPSIADAARGAADLLLAQARAIRRALRDRRHRVAGGDANGHQRAPSD